ncbi:hypothetical protein MKX03_000012 [Papaver bracteatum]|nr:hypothetical protein MKX03_000012 [Papaver bracteatum]
MHQPPPPTDMPPAAASNGATPENPIIVIGPNFCAPYPVDLTITKKLLAMTEGNFVKGTLLSIRDRRVIVDSAGVPLVSLQQKILTCHRRWQVYRGDSSESSDLLFSVKKSSLVQIKTTLHVFLASNTSEDMHKEHTVKSIVLDKDTYSITIYPNVDYAFIVALCAVLNEVNNDRNGED